MSDAAGSPRSDESATIASWLQQVLPRAIVFARSLTGDHHAAEDIVHDCVCRLIDRKDRYDLPTDGLKLLMRSISNAAIDRLRRVEPRSL